MELLALIIIVAGIKAMLEEQNTKNRIKTKKRNSEIYWEIAEKLHVVLQEIAPVLSVQKPITAKSLFPVTKKRVWQKSGEDILFFYEVMRTQHIPEHHKIAEDKLNVAMLKNFGTQNFRVERIIMKDSVLLIVVRYQKK